MNLKRIAIKGGERGPLYDQGVLAVIKQIEETGRFKTDPLNTLMYAAWAFRKLGANVLTEEELATVEHTLKTGGWTLDEWGQYTGGVKQAESLLSSYKE
jgi:hypothetical protein